MNLSYCVPRQRKLLKILLTKNEWLTGIQLSCMLHVTDRTVRSDVSVLNYILEQYHSSIISARGKGYYLQTKNKEALLFVLSKNSELNNISKEACIRKILLLLLTTDKEIDLYDLEEKYFISRTGLESYIKNIEKILVNFSSLEIIRKNGKIKLFGPESSIRFMLNEILKIQYDHELGKFYCENEYIAEIDFSRIYNYVISCIKESDLFLDENGIVSIALCLAIFKKRIEDGQFIEKKEYHDTLRNQNQYDNYDLVYSVAKKMYQAIIFDDLGLEKERAEIHQIATQLSFVNLFQTKDFSKEELIKNTSPLIITIVDSLVQVIKKDFYLDLTNDEELYIGLNLHIRALVNRNRYYHEEINPILDSIKSQYPFVFELSLHIYEIFNDIMGIKLTEDELSYVTIHIAGAIERLSMQYSQSQIKVVIISHLSASYSDLLVSKLNSVYSSKIQIVGLFPIYRWKEALDANPSIILVTSSVLQMMICKSKSEIPILKIGPLFSVDNETALNILLTRIRKNIIYTKKEEDSIFSKFDKELFFQNVHCQTVKETIDFLCEQLEKKDWVPETFRKFAFEREELASTALANAIAIPHPITACAYNTAFAVAILKKPILWGKYKVQIVFLIAVKPEEKSFIKDFFNFISFLMDTPKDVQKIINIRDFSEFLKFIQSIKI